MLNLGLLHVFTQAAGEVIDSQAKLVRLWVHECLRVFHDRLIDDTDRAWIIEKIKDKISHHFKLKPQQVRFRLYVPVGNMLEI